MKHDIYAGDDESGWASDRIERDIEREPSLLSTLRAGDRVVLPDGEDAVVVRHAGSDVAVEQPWKAVGRGPWTYQRWQLDDFDEEEPTWPHARFDVGGES